jgi:hypothetical protein
MGLRKDPRVRSGEGASGEVLPEKCRCFTFQRLSATFTLLTASLHPLATSVQQVSSPHGLLGRFRHMNCSEFQRLAFATRRLALARAAPSMPTWSPMEMSSCGVRREWLPRPPQT